MTRAAAGGDTGKYRDRQATDAFTDHGVEVGSARGLKFGLAAEFERQSTESVCNDKNDFAAVVVAQITHELMEVHKLDLPLRVKRIQYY